MKITQIATLAVLIAGVAPHTWVEQLSVIDDSGKYTGTTGYIRSYIPRQLAKGDTGMSYFPGQLKANIDSTDLLCDPTPNQNGVNQQVAGTINPDFPQLRAKPGDYVAMRYLENGHVSKNFLLDKPGSAGLVYVYATTKPVTGEKLVNALKWGPEGDLAKGRLLTVQNYDDGRCYEEGPTTPLGIARKAADPNSGYGTEWCETNIRIPEDTPTGLLTVHWVWQWPTLPSVGLPKGKDQMYTSCMDIQVSTDSTVLKSAVMKGKMQSQDPQISAVSNFKERAANLTLPAGSVWHNPAGSSSNSSMSQQDGSEPAAMSEAPPAAAVTAPPAVTSTAKSFIVRTSTSTVMVTETVIENVVIRPSPTGARFRA